MLALIATSRNEGDVMECWLRHHLAEGVDLILVADNSDPGEGTRESLIGLASETGRVYWQEASGPIHYQPALMNALAERARQAGADWVIASDIDELWGALGGTLASALYDSVPPKQYALRWLHHDWDHRRTAPERLMKVAFRPTPDSRLANGNHEVSPATTWSTDRLFIRELHFRSFQHFKAKVADRCRTLDPQARARGDGVHMTRLEGASEDELRKAWKDWLAVPTVYDPIPSRSVCRPLP